MQTAHVISFRRLVAYCCLLAPLGCNSAPPDPAAQAEKLFNRSKTKLLGERRLSAIGKELGTVDWTVTPPTAEVRVDIKGFIAVSGKQEPTEFKGKLQFEHQGEEKGWVLLKDKSVVVDKATGLDRAPNEDNPVEKIVVKHFDPAEL